MREGGRLVRKLPTLKDSARFVAKLLECAVEVCTSLPDRFPILMRANFQANGFAKAAWLAITLPAKVGSLCHVNSGESLTKRYRRPGLPAREMLWSQNYQHQ